MMRQKLLASFAALWAVFYCLNAHAQYVPNHAFPLGTGAGSTGYTSVGPCASGTPIVGQGVTSDPACSLGLGAVTVATPSAGNNSTLVPNTNWVATYYALINSPAFTGSPTTTTPTFNDNSTRIPTTAWVTSNFLPKVGLLPCAVTSQSAKSANYPVANADSGTLFVITNRSTITFPNTYTQGFCATLYNGDANKAQKVTVNGTTYWLWPGQTEQVYAIAGGALVYSGPHRYHNSALTLYVAPSPSCNDANDGLTQDASGQICSINTAIANIQTYVDSLGTNPIIQLADGTYTQAVSYAGFGPYAKDGININGHSGFSAGVKVTAPAGQPAFTCRDYCTLFLNDLEVICTNASSSCVSSSQFSTVDLKNVIMGGADGNSAFHAWSHGHIDFNTGNIIFGNAGNLLIADEGGEISIPNQVLTCSGTLAITFFANVSHLGHINASGLTFSGCGSVFGTKYVAAYNGTINTGAGGDSFFPGTTAGSTSAGGQYQ